MKKASATIFLLFGLSVCAVAQQDAKTEEKKPAPVAQIAAEADYGTSDVKAFRAARDRDFRNAVLSPLTREDFLSFKGLLYFDESEKFAVKAKLETTADKKVFTIQTSVGTTRRYVKYGVLKFELGGEAFVLTAFQPEIPSRNAEYRKLLFIPFRDRTSGKETYGAGRYLDIKIPAGDEIILNFNLAYNPSCAYGRDDFSCPLPPKENFLETEIRAGEKIFPFAARKQ